MEKILAMVVLTFLTAACGSPRTRNYPTVKVEVVFLDRSRDTLNVRGEYSFYSDGNLYEIGKTGRVSELVATQVKYVKRLEK